MFKKTKLGGRQVLPAIVTARQISDSPVTGRLRRLSFHLRKQRSVLGSRKQLRLGQVLQVC